MYIRRPMCLLAVGFLLLMHILLQLFYSIPDDYDSFPQLESGIQMKIEGIVEKKEIKNKSFIIYLNKVKYQILITEQSNQTGFVRNKADQTKQGQYSLILYLSDDSQYQNIKIGSTLLAEGKYEKFEVAENEGQFNKRKYYYINGYDGCLKKSHIIAISDDYEIIKNELFVIREKSERIIDKLCEDEEKRGVIKALLLGDKTELESDVKELYQGAGISHILSLSGLHIATLGMMIYSVLAKLGIAIFPASAISSLMIIMYGVMTGMNISTVRALIMFLMGIVAKNIGRTYDLLSAAAFSAILIIVSDPIKIYDTAFLLSFGAIAGMGLIYPMLNDGVEYIVDKFTPYRMVAGSRQQEQRKENSLSINIYEHLLSLIEKVLKSLCVSISIQITTLPIVAYNYYCVPLYGIFLNLIIVPFMTILLLLCIMLLFIGYAGVINGIVSIITKIVIAILNMYEYLAEMFSGMKGNMWIIGKPELINCYAYYCVIAVILIINNRGYEIDETYKNDKYNNADYAKKVLNKRKNVKEIKKISLIAALVFINVVALGYKPKSQVEIKALCVGQGDSTLIYGKDSPTMLVDGGSTDIKEVGKYRIIPCLKANGVGRLDYVFISHLDTDHVNGVIELLEDKYNQIDIGKLVIPFSAEQQNGGDGNYISVTQLAKKKGIPVVYMRAGDEIRYKNMRITCLSPDDKNSEYMIRDTNDNSLVLSLEYENGFRAYFMGDVSSAMEPILVDKLKKADFLKVAHHGSKYSSSMILLDAARPEIATISVGKHSQYGHPHKETLERLANIGAKVFRTDECGQVTVKVDNGKARVRRFTSDIAY